MLGDLNKSFDAKKANAANNQLIAESVLSDEELLEEMEDGVDADSIPDEVYKKVDQALDSLIGDDIDDDEIEEMIDDEDFDDEEIDIALAEAAGAWYDDENIGHPDGDRRNGTKKQPEFKGGSMA